LPRDVQRVIGGFLTDKEICASHHVLRWDAMIRRIRFPMRLPTSREDHVRFCHWLWRWRRTMCAVESVEITYILQCYRAPVFEMLGLIELDRVRLIRIMHVLTLFDSMSPRLLFALRRLFSKFGRQCQVRVHVDARLMPFCRHMHGEFITSSTIGTMTSFSGQVRDTRQTPLTWLSSFPHRVNIRCWCFNHDDACRTLMRIPDHTHHVSIIHS